MNSADSDDEIPGLESIDDEQNQPKFIEKNGIKFQNEDACLAMIQGSFNG